MSLLLLSTFLAAPSVAARAPSVEPPLVDDLPPGSELALRVAMGALSPEVKSALDELRPLASSWPALGSVAGAVSEVTDGPWSEPLRRCGVDPATPGAMLTVVADLDDAGAVIAGVLRGVTPRMPAAAGDLEERSVDGERAFVLAGRDIAFAPGPSRLVVGTERGVQRLLRRLRSTGGHEIAGGLPADALSRIALAVRRQAPVTLAVAMTPRVRRLLAGKHVAAAAFLAPVTALTATLDEGGIDVALTVSGSRREAVAGGVRALFAGLNAAGQGLLALGELASSLPGLGPGMALLPRGLDPVRFAPLATRWLASFRVAPEVHVRPRGVEVHADVTGWRGLALAALALGASGPGGAGQSAMLAGAPGLPTSLGADRNPGRGAPGGIAPRSGGMDSAARADDERGAGAVDDGSYEGDDAGSVDTADGGELSDDDGTGVEDDEGSYDSEDDVGDLDGGAEDLEGGSAAW